MSDNRIDDDPYPHQFIFGREITPDDGITQFSESDNDLGNPLSFEDVEKLMDKGFLDMASQYQNSPPASVLMLTAGLLARFSGRFGQDPVSVQLIGHVNPDADSSSGINITGLVAIPDTPDSVICEIIQQEFRVMGDVEAAKNDEYANEIGSVYDAADQLVANEDICRVEWE